MTFYKIIKNTYHFIAGGPTSRNFLNFKYLSTYVFHKDLKKTLEDLEGDVVDFGCGKKPYKTWFKKTGTYVGVDLFDYSDVDVLVKDGKIPLEDNSFDIALATQVFEHTESLDYLSELHRILKPGGKIIVTVPFLYHVHEDRDHRRFTKQGLEKTLKDYSFSVDYIKTQGGVGSTLGTTLVYFVDSQIRGLGVAALVLLSPVILIWFLVLVPLVNLSGILLDRLDDTNRFYSNLISVSIKK